MAKFTNFSTFGNELYTGKRSYDIVGKRKIWFTIAAVMVLISILSPILRGGFNLGIDFRGGSEFTVLKVTNLSVDTGTKAVTDVVPGQSPRVSVLSGNGIQVQTDKLSDDETIKVKDSLVKAYGVTSSDVASSFVGPTWGADVTKQALIGLIVFVVLATILMALYFRTWKMSLAAVFGMLFVQVTTAGIYSITNVEVTPSAIIGFLTILSYSLYDIVVVFDKIRENTSDIGTSTRRTFSSEVNLAVNQTLVRSINTSMVALLPVASILFIGSFLLGAGTLRDLSLSLFIGIIMGGLTTVFIASPLYAMLRQNEPALAKQAERVKARIAAETTKESAATASV
ncbi:protein-export membrane protein [Renibacterium salmoninarum ATCC 33209]|uniref:Protein-export membrane protein SecF n=1 Tax=Renibacterium salmoninarum (strain ATCC 33209 / DSM 20767 / JCM 11484 / NBRC 15589 / NCIMB 2235) TaxID=288705 RepID=A9WSE1_RENSM|nr:protein translocase subunit SecF [Renibacterium salmoninarum]ABY23729.1 protein-export membrane protein [Renibacterium salmoninarum ATCC 33209]